ncbi:proteasome regulatory particle subunit [Saitoella coloradoensis]
MATDTDVAPPQYPSLALAQQLFVLREPSLQHLHAETLPVLLDKINELSAYPLYAELKSLVGSEWKQSVYDEMKSKAEAEEKLLNDDAEKAKEQEAEGEEDLRKIEFKRINLVTRIHDFERSRTLVDAILAAPTTSIPMKLDFSFTLLRQALFVADVALTASTIESTRTLIDQGGDWDRRNKLKAYEGLFLLSQRQYAQAANLLLDCATTFTSTELCTYEEVVAWAVVAAVVSLPRTELKTRVIDSPEVLAVLPPTHALVTLTQSLYICDYASFFRALAEAEQSVLLTTRYTRPHARWYVRELRRRSYAQLLESYRSVSLSHMAAAFGVSTSYIDADLARFIVGGGLAATIDRVGGTVETKRLDEKNGVYTKLIKVGDGVLNKLQRYGAVVEGVE